MAENLALDELLLEEACAGETPADTLRLWQPTEPAVVLGRSNKRAEEVNEGFCEEHGIGIYRRSSGGGSIVAGPGCFMYSLILDRERNTGLEGVDAIHCAVLKRLSTALKRIDKRVSIAGTSDLVIETRPKTLLKFSGNSLRVRRQAVLYHGTLLYDFDVSLIERCLKSPPRQPEYRAQRNHEAFVTNLATTTDELKRVLIDQWQAVDEVETYDEQRVAQLVNEKYGTSKWND